MRFRKYGVATTRYTHRSYVCVRMESMSAAGLPFSSMEPTGAAAPNAAAVEPAATPAPVAAGVEPAAGPYPVPQSAGFFGFPNPVNELAARSVAGGVAVLAAATLGLSIVVGHDWLWLSIPLAYGFIARVLAGPKLSPLGQLAVRVVAPRLGDAKFVAGPPKRFAQAIGAVVTTLCVLGTALGFTIGVQALLGLMIIFAVLESAFAFCVGCRIFGVLMRFGLVPAQTCEACANISLRIGV